MNSAAQDELLVQFVAAFQKLDDRRATSAHVIGWQLTTGSEDEYGSKAWHAARVDTDSIALEALYAKLPARFPPLYERLLLTYRWDIVDLELFRLLPNPPDGDFLGLAEKKDFLTNFLIKAGYIRFGMGPDIDFDPVCFDLKSRKKNREFRIVKINHEAILCREKLTIVSELASTFRELVLKVIALADLKTAGSKR